MFNKQNKKEKPVNDIATYTYKESFSIIYNNGKVENFIGESMCTPALFTTIDKDIIKIYSYKMPSNIDKIYYRNIKDIDYTVYNLYLLYFYNISYLYLKAFYRNIF